MVSFYNIATAALAACAVAVLAQTTPDQVVQNIKMITQKSQALKAPAKSITIVNGPLIIIGQGPFPQINRGFVDIVSTGATALSLMEGMPPVPAGPESDAIFDAFLNFVYVHQELLNILIGKASLFNTVPLIGEPVAAVLRQVESVVDTLTFAIVDVVESRASDIQSQGNSLGMTIETAIKSYTGVQITTRDNSPVSRVKRALVAAAA